MEQVCNSSILIIDGSIFEFLDVGFCIRNGPITLHETQTMRNSQQQGPYSVMVPDLRLCSVRPMNDNDRRFVFEILSPNRFCRICFRIERRLFVSVVRTFCKLIRKNQCDQWVHSLQLAISQSFKNTEWCTTKFQFRMSSSYHWNWKQRIGVLFQSSPKSAYDDQPNTLVAEKVALKQQM